MTADEAARLLERLVERIKDLEDEMESHAEVIGILEDKLLAIETSINWRPPNG